VAGGGPGGTDKRAMISISGQVIGDQDVRFPNPVFAASGPKDLRCLGLLVCRRAGSRIDYRCFEVLDGVQAFACWVTCACCARTVDG
jgi:hypothetical protein